jgi:hypothetical protein
MAEILNGPASPSNAAPGQPFRSAHARLAFDLTFCRLDLSPSFDGTFLKFFDHEDFRTFYACAPCDGRIMDRTIRVTGDSIEEFAPVSLVPELDLIDEVYERLNDGKSIADLAVPKAARELERSVRNAADECRWEGEFLPGELWRHEIHATSPHRRNLRFHADCAGPYTFTFQLRGNALRIVDLQQGRD